MSYLTIKEANRLRKIAILSIIGSLLDNISIIPLNSEVLLIYSIKEYAKKNQKISRVIIYVLPSVIGAIIAYTFGYYWKLLLGKKIFEFHIGSSLIGFIKNTFPSGNFFSYLLLCKSFIPGIPIAIINIFAGKEKDNFIIFVLCSIVIRLLRSILIPYLDKKTGSMLFVILSSISYSISISFILKLIIDINTSILKSYSF